MLSRLPSAGVVHVTDGAPRDFSDWIKYAARRRREAVAALALLGSNRPEPQCLGIPDSQAMSESAALIRYLAEMLINFEFVVTHAYEGGHPDHDTTALSVHAACRWIQKVGHNPPSIFEMTSYHGFGSEDYVRGIFVPRDDAEAPTELILTPAERQLKRQMFACYASQQPVLEMFSLELERFRSAPRYDFFLPPHTDRLFYDGEGWRDAAKETLAKLGLIDSM